MTRRKRSAIPLISMSGAQLAEFVLERTAPVAGGCVVYLGTCDRDGYAEIRTATRYIGMAHRIVYAAKRGPIPEGLTLDHLCRVRNCVNPDHLEPVTAVENTMRGNFPSAVNARKTKCDYGHEFTFENTYISPTGWRVCRTCNRRRSMEYKQRLRAARSGVS